ncbi:MAG: nucleotidyltransferase family protein [Armatimonadota bacterium]
MSEVRRAVVLAAGRGKRMMPLTANCPKPLIPVAGTPILERVLRGLRAAGIEEAIIVHGYLKEMIEDYFGDGARVDMRLTYREQDPPNGTGGALLQVQDLCGDEPFVLHWGDILISPDNYPEVLADYAEFHPAVVEGLNWMDDPSAGAAVYREGNRVTKIIEKPAPGTSTTNWNNAGVFVLSPRVWPYVHRLTPSPRGELEFTDVLHMLVADGDYVLGHELHGLWSDVGTPQIVDQLNADPRMQA